MILVGLTGGIASGKSTVSDFLREEGAVIVDADEIAHEVILKGNRAYQPVIDFFGQEIVSVSGEIDRKKLGEIVFHHPLQLAQLNEIIHPLVFEQLESEKKRIEQKQPQSVMVFDAPLLIEVNAHQRMDWVLLVYVDQKTQLARLTQRDGLTKEAAKLRIDTQMPLDEKRVFADEIIDNQKPREVVKKEVRDIYQRLIKKR